jgi:hypothetical protein
MPGLTKPVTKCHKPEEQKFDKPAVFSFMVTLMFVYFVYELSTAGNVYNLAFCIVTPCILARKRRQFGETPCIHLSYVVMMIV